MKPDMEDYADIDEGKQGPSSRAMSWMVLAVAIGGFTALAYYAYHSGSGPSENGEAMMVEADPAPIKAAPQQADGEQFANKDKTIYDVIAPNGQSGNVEKLMPEPEHPVAAANVEDSEDDIPTTPAAVANAANAAAKAAPAAPAPSAAVTPAPAATNSTSTFVASDAQKTDPLDTKTPAPTATAVAPAPSSAPTPMPSQTVSEQTVATKATPVPEKPAEKSYANPQMVNEKPSAKKEDVKPAAEKTDKAEKVLAKKPEKPAALASGSGGSYKVQLGAFKSEAEAQAAWKKISAKHGLSGSPTIVQADVNGTTFYRLRTGSYANSSEAKAACASMSGQACMPVK